MTSRSTRASATCGRLATTHSEARHARGSHTSSRRRRPSSSSICICRTGPGSECLRRVRSWPTHGQLPVYSDRRLLSRRRDRACGSARACSSSRSGKTPSAYRRRADGAVRAAGRTAADRDNAMILPRPLLLVVDDEVDVLALVRSRRGGGGLRRHLRARRAQGIEIAEARRPDLVMVDLRMPDVAGSRRRARAAPRRRQGDDCPDDRLRVDRFRGRGGEARAAGYHDQAVRHGAAEGYVRRRARAERAPRADNGGRPRGRRAASSSRA